MLRIAIVEDEESQMQNTRRLLDHFMEERQVEYHVDAYTDGVSFLEGCRIPYDIVLLDIEMPQMNGLETARRLRAMDETAILIFVTKIGKFAINGYEVSALGYILKPINAFALQMTMQKAMKILAQRTDRKIVLQMKEGVITLSSRELVYIEVFGHKLSYHTREKTVEAYGNLKEEEAHLAEYHFSRCSNAFLVNLAYVKGIIGNAVYLSDGVELRVSRGMKKSFTDDYMAYLGK